MTMVTCQMCGWTDEWVSECPTCGTDLPRPTAPPDPPPGVEGPDVFELHRAAAAGVRALIESRGLDPDSGSLVDTPARVVRAFEEMTAGYDEDPDAILSTRFSPEGEEEVYNEMIVLRGVQFSSLCEHHLLPFTGTATVGYVPGESSEVVGLSKLARLVDCFSRRLQIQERMTAQIAGALDRALSPAGAGCIVRAHHQCMSCRGVRRPGAEMVTSALHGVFREDGSARAEFLNLD